METGTVANVAGFVALLCGIAAAAAPAPSKHTVEFGGIKRGYYVIDAGDVRRSAPLVIALHGSQGRGRQAVQPWITLAESEQLVVVGPDSREPAAWRIRPDGPAFITAVIADLERRRPIDRSRLYLFGHSGGALYALTLAMIESNTYAAVAVHAGAWRTKRELAIEKHAVRKIPVAMFIGDQDPFFPVAAARRTHDVLQIAAHPVQLVVLPGRGHDYAKVAPEVNRAAWNFFRHVSTPSSAEQ